ncbi:hypothetical protein ERJ75_000826600 [Trypanosoma vivax]|uniref:Uncharacterized protein n=1 Tax=Trypanosoma vivax (strain Y486) TaxID=1055687 RepID=G0TZ76_TRYVY|nr:hypothetical protein TRVL_05980 [Trypanosoma vivax]KAH8613093.1 hypothetical protein ERJ75_000826600 [Trypanosoma vivax]CCC49279.1 conserved hypothetical protein [Trypanosoma vivax Y486]
MAGWNVVLQDVQHDVNSNDDGSQPHSAAAIRTIEEVVESTRRRVIQLERNFERQRAALGEVRGSVSRFEDFISKTTSDIQSIQRQLEHVVISLERERGIITDHKEQLRLFARESTHRDIRRTDVSEGSTSFLFFLASWLYRPLVHFANGCYTLLSPLINTIRSLSIFNSDVLIRRADVGTRLHDTQTDEDLLSRLQKGLLDPIAVLKKG